MFREADFHGCKNDYEIFDPFEKMTIHELRRVAKTLDKEICEQIHEMSRDKLISFIMMHKDTSFVEKNSEYNEVQLGKIARNDDLL